MHARIVHLFLCSQHSYLYYGLQDCGLQYRSLKFECTQVIQIRYGDSHMGCAAGNGVAWQNKHQSMYHRQRSAQLEKVRHFNVVLDGAIHSKNDTLVSILWSWEANAACYGNVMMAVGGKYILPDELDMPDYIAELIATRKHERWAAFRQLQGLCYILWNKSIRSN